MKRFAIGFMFALVVISGLTPVQVHAQVSPPAIVTYQNGNSRLGQNLQETILTPTNFNATNFGQIFNWQTDGNIYAQPLYVPNLTINGATHNVVFVVTEADGIYAFDADSQALNPNPLWYTSLVNGTTVTPIPCMTHRSSACTISPIAGITGTPVINLATNTMYFIAKTQVVVNGNTSNPYFAATLHALNILTGQEQPYGPYTICSVQYVASGMGCQFQTGLFNPLSDGQRPGLLLEPQSGFSQGVIWAGFAGQGMMLAFDASNLKQLADWMATPHPEDTTGGGGIWGSGGGVSGDANSNVYVSIGDGTFDVNVGGNNYGDSIVKLNLVTSTTTTSGYAMQVMDYFTPPDEACRQTTDTDLGSGGPVLLPPQPGDVPNLIFIAGKGDVPTCDSANPMFLVNADDMGGLGGGVQSVPTTASLGFLSSGAYFNNGTTSSIYMGGPISTKSGDNFRQYELTNGLLNSTSVSQSPETYLASPTGFVTANGTTNGIVWVIQRAEVVSQETGTLPGQLHAYNAANLSQELYSTTTNSSRDTMGPAVKFAVPTVVNGKAYAGTQTGLYVYGMCPCVGSAGDATLTPSSLTYATQVKGTSSPAQTATFTNTGTVAMTISSVAVTGAAYSQTNNCGTSLAGGASCTVNVVFTPTAAGTQTGTLTVTSNAANSPQTTTLSGVGTVLSISPTSLSFGNQVLETSSSSQTITITNVSPSAAVAFTKTSVTGTNATSFTIQSSSTCPLGTGSLAAGASCTLVVVFDPQATGALSANITITAAGGGSPHTVPMSGTGVTNTTSNANLTPASFTFATQVIKTSSAAQQATLTNTGSVAISISSIATTATYTQTNNCGTSLAGNASCTINVVFTPTKAGTQTGTLTVTDNAPNSPQTATLSGVGTVLSISPTSLSFGTETTGTSSAAQTITLTNLATTAVATTKMSVTGTNAGSFAIQSSSTCPLGTGSIAAGASCTLVVVFDPQATGALTANVSVVASGGGSPHTIPMTGTGD